VEFVFVGSDKKEDTQPGLDKVMPTEYGLILKDVAGLRLRLKRRLEDLGGYDVVKVGPYRVQPRATVLVTDPAVILAIHFTDATTQLNLEFSMGSSSALDVSDATAASRRFVAQASLATFGPPVMAVFHADAPSLPVVRPAGDVYGCEPYSVDLPSAKPGTEKNGFVLLVRRGLCTFQAKSHRAAMAGAKALLVSSIDDETFMPAPDDETGSALVATVLVANSTGEELERSLRLAEDRGKGEAVWVGWAEEQEPRPFVVNGHRILNAIVAEQP
jgi:hypothetical protein